MKKLFTLKSNSTMNRILITLLLCIIVGTQNLWGQTRFLPRSVTVDPNATTAQVSFSDLQVSDRWVSQMGDFFHCVGLGNIETTSDRPTVNQENWYSPVTVTVNFRQKDASLPKGGAVVIWFDYNWGLDRDFCVINVPYACEVDEDGKGKDIVWDLKTVKGPSNNNDNDTYAWYQGMKGDNNRIANYQRAINSEWVTKYKVRQVDSSPHYFNGPSFAAKEAVNGNNAYYIPETAGLIIDTQTRKESFGVSCATIPVDDQTFYEANDKNNEAEKAVGYVNRCTYSCPSFGNDNKPKENGSGKTTLTIPNLKKGWFVKLYWGRHADNAGYDYKATNVTDLNGTYISSNFHITGSWLPKNGEEYVGPTTFIVNDDGAVTFELQDYGWTNLFRIEVSKNYSTDMKVVEVEGIHEEPIVGDDGITSTNSPEGNRYDWALNTGTDHVTLIGNETKTKIYSGISGEVLCHNAVSPEFRIETEGNVQCTPTTVQWERRYTSNGQLKGSYNLLKLNVTGGYGNIKIIQEMKLNGYVLDKKEQWIAVGHVDPQQYPYTWEFTSYNMNDTYCGWNKLYDYLQQTQGYDNSFSHYGQYDLDRPGYDGIYRMHTYKKIDGALEKNLLKPLFAQGSQYAYASNDNGPLVAKEYEGLGITIDGVGPKDANNDYYSYIMGKGHGWLWGVKELLIPNVDPGMAVYIQTETASTKPYFEIEGGGTITSDAAALGDGATLVEKKWTNNGFEDDNIDTYVLGAIITPTSGNKAHVRVKGLDPTKRIFRIGVTNIRKEINKYGYATESRNREIDHMMTGFLTKADAHAYFAKEFSEAPNVTSGQESIGIVKLVPAVKTEYVSIDRGGNSVPQNYENIPEGTGVVLFSQKVKDKGEAINVPLFVPAIHVNNTSTSDNLLVGPVTSTYIDGTAKDYILTNIYQHRQNLNVNLEGSGTEEKIGFYRAQPGTLGANKAYLNLDNVTSSSAKLVLFSFFDDEEEDIHNGIATGIEDASHLIDNGQLTMDNAEWYNLNGQKLNGVPSQKGLYIVNGKKVLVK